MKKIYTLIIFSFFLFSSEKSFSQAFTIVMPDTCDVGDTSTDVEVYKLDSIMNDTTISLSIEVVRVQNVTTPGWKTEFCMNGTCYLPTTDSVHFTFQPHQHDGFIMHFITSSIPVSGTVLMAFRNLTPPTKTIYKHFCVNSITGVNELDAQNVSVKISPNPITSGSVFSINISSKQNSTTSFSLSVYDIIGNIVSKYSNLNNGNNLISLNTSQGIYFYKLVSDNQQVSAGKLIVVQ